MSFLRAIEKAIRRGTLRIIGRSGLQGPDDPLKAPLPERPRILLVRIDRIGDAIVSTPILRSLRERFPEGRIDLLLGEKNRMVASLLPDVDNVFVLHKKAPEAKKTIKELRRIGYDAVVNLHLNRSASASLVSRLVRSEIVIESQHENAFVTPNGTFEHVVTMTARLLKPFGIGPIDESNESNHPLSLLLPESAVKKGERILNDLLSDDKNRAVVLINVSSAHLSSEWLGDHVVALAKELSAKKILPAICGAPGESELVARIAAACDAIAIPPLYDYAEFAAVVERADVVVTPDTSTIHLAAAMGRPTVALYASEQNARAWRPWGVPQRTFIVNEGMGRPGPSEVSSAVEGLLPFSSTHQTEQTEIPTRSV